MPSLATLFNHLPEKVMPDALEGRDVKVNTGSKAITNLMTHSAFAGEEQELPQE